MIEFTRGIQALPGKLNNMNDKLGYETSSQSELKLNQHNFYFLANIKRIVIITGSDLDIENVTFDVDITKFGFGVQKILIRYRIKENRLSSLYIKVPNMQSYGVKENNFKIRLLSLILHCWWLMTRQQIKCSNRFSIKH